MPVTNYVWDGQQYLMERDGSHVTQAVWTNEPDVFTNLITQRRGGATQYPHFDALGSTRQLTDASETITDVLLYDAWGSVVARVGVTIFPLQFVGRFGYYYDLETNTFYIIRRIYEPEAGRWWSIDPINIMLQFVYCLSNPTTRVDPSGFRGIKIMWIKDRGHFFNSDFGAGMDPRDTEDPRKEKVLTSFLAFRWQPKKEAFLDECGACLCDEVGFIQVITNYGESIPNSWLSDLVKKSDQVFSSTEKQRKWSVDGGIPFQTGLSGMTRTTNPCTDADPISLFDAPGIIISQKDLSNGVIVNKLFQYGIACVFCNKGAERIQGQLTVYGCLRWWHTWEYKTSGKEVGYFVERRFSQGSDALEHQAVRSYDYNWNNTPFYRYEGPGHHPLGYPWVSAKGIDAFE